MDYKDLGVTEICDIESDSFSGDAYFPTMIFQAEVSEKKLLNNHLVDIIYAERSRDENGIERSNFRKLGGWHSHNNLHHEKAYKPLVERVHQAGRRISHRLGYHADKHLKISTMWSIINAPGSSNKSHVHPGSHWSGVYYVKTPEKSGDIEFIDPRTPHVMNQLTFQPNKPRNKESWTSVRFAPEAGKMLIFPSWLYHSVDPNLSEKTGRSGDRIIISFNLAQVINFHM